MLDSLKEYYKEHEEAIVVLAIAAASNVAMYYIAKRSIEARRIVRAHIFAPGQPDNYFDDKTFEVDLLQANGKIDRWYMNPVTTSNIREFPQQVG